MLAREVGRIVEEVLRRDETTQTREGRAALAEAITAFARRLHELRQSPDVAQLLLLADDLRRMP